MTHKNLNPVNVDDPKRVAIVPSRRPHSAPSLNPAGHPSRTQRAGHSRVSRLQHDRRHHRLPVQGLPCSPQSRTERRVSRQSKPSTEPAFGA